MSDLLDRWSVALFVILLLVGAPLASFLVA
jgi:hypothetical protein